MVEEAAHLIGFTKIVLSRFIEQNDEVIYFSR